MTFLCYYSSLLRPSRSQLSGSHKGHSANHYFSTSTLRKPVEARSVCAISFVFLIYTPTMGNVFGRVPQCLGLGLFYLLAQLQQMGRNVHEAPFHNCALQNELSFESSWLK